MHRAPTRRSARPTATHAPLLARASAGGCQSFIQSVTQNGYVLTSTSTCAAVRQRAPFDLLLNPACARIRNRASSEPPPTLTPPPAHAPQCAPDCASCSTAGAGACDAGSCRPGYGLTFAKKCAPVRQRAPFDLLCNPACARIRNRASSEPPPTLTPPPAHVLHAAQSAVRGQLRLLQHSRCRRLRRGILCDWLRADVHLHMRSGAPGSLSTGPIGNQARHPCERTPTKRNTPSPHLLLTGRSVRTTATRVQTLALASAMLEDVGVAMA